MKGSSSGHDPSSFLHDPVQIAALVGCAAIILVLTLVEVRSWPVDPSLFIGSVAAFAVAEDMLLTWRRILLRRRAKA